MLKRIVNEALPKLLIPSRFVNDMCSVLATESDDEHPSDAGCQGLIYPEDMKLRQVSTSPSDLF